MVQAAHRWFDHDEQSIEDHIVVLREATWEGYEHLLAMRGEHSAPRISYLDGEVEIMSPSRDHEGIKSTIGCLVEVWCLEKSIRFTTLGSWTLKKRKKEAGLEPDECFIFGDPKANRPHLAIEVIWTSGGIDKLEIYRRLQVQEVWIWRQGALTPHVLRNDTYEPVATSEVLPGIDLVQLVSFLDRPTTYDAICEYRDALRA